MALTIVVRSGSREGVADPALTLDAPRIVLGRSDSCEVRLPDATVSPRHASLRQKGGSWVLVDEGSLNGTWVGRTKLSAQAPQPVASGALIRLGRVWLELKVEAAVVNSSGAVAAKELALQLVARALAADGEEPGPRVTVVEGPDLGAAITLEEAGRAYTIGRSKECDLALTDANAGRRHVAITRRGDAILVQDLGSSMPATLDGGVVGARDTTWRPGQGLVVAGTHLALEFAAADALLEVERGPDERMKDAEIEPPRKDAPRDLTPTPTPAGEAASESETPGVPIARETAEEMAAHDARLAKRQKKPGTWAALDGIVILVALGVLGVSIAGAWWLLGR